MLRNPPSGKRLNTLPTDTLKALAHIEALCHPVNLTENRTTRMNLEINIRHEQGKLVAVPQALIQGDSQLPAERLNSQQPDPFPQWTEEEVIEQIRLNDHFVCEVILALQEQQTPSEQVNDRTITNNGRGFSKANAATFGRMAKRLQRHGKLNSADLAYCRETLSNGFPRLAKHREQILELMRHQDLQSRDQQPATLEDRQ
jgi:hypothetical protein